MSSMVPKPGLFAKVRSHIHSSQYPYPNFSVHDAATVTKRTSPDERYYHSFQQTGHLPIYF